MATKVYFLRGEYLKGVINSIQAYEDSTSFIQGQKIIEGDLPSVLIGRFFKKWIRLVPSEVAKIGRLIVVRGRVAEMKIVDDHDDFSSLYQFSTVYNNKTYELVIAGPYHGLVAFTE